MDHSAYIKEPENARRAVLLIHGICSSPRHFDFLIPEFDDSWAVYNILLDGHGQTVKDFSDTSMKKWKAQTHAMLDMLSVRYDSILVVGYSMGTLLEIEALPQYPKVCGMLLLNVPMRPWVSSRILSKTLKLTKGITDPNDPIDAACEKSIGIHLTPGLWQYTGWIPRFLELLGLCRHCRRHKDNIRVPCIAYLGTYDELVSMRSRKYLEGNPNVTLRIMEDVGHLYYPPEHTERMRSDLRALMQKI